MKLFPRLVIVCSLIYQSLAYSLINSPSQNFQCRGWRRSASVNGNDQLDALQKRLQAKLLQNQAEVKLNVNDKEFSSTSITQSVKQEKIILNQVQQEKKARYEIKSSPATAEQSKNVQVLSMDNKSITGLQVAEGVGLGLLPYLLIPALLLNSIRGFIQKPKSTQENPSVTQVKAQTYTKSLTEGAKEGYFELASGKKSRDLEDIRNGYKIVAASFGVAAAFAVASILFGGPIQEVAVIPNAGSAVVQEERKTAVVSKDSNSAKFKTSNSIKIDINSAPEKPLVSSPVEKLKGENKIEGTKDSTSSIEKSPVKIEENIATLKLQAKSEESKDSSAATIKVEAPVVEQAKPSLSSDGKPPVSQTKEIVEEVNIKERPASKVEALKKVVEEKSPSNPKLQIINIEGTNTNVKKTSLKQPQPDFVDLTKFQSLRNKKN